MTPCAGRREWESTRSSESETRDGVVGIINLHPAGHKAKPYQVKQVRSILVKTKLGEIDVDQI
ncbi:MAG TPA: hypothetical protein DCY89_10360 [Gammaproteobacteria bacterium]|nr:hypothetical protein [Gammaproteobacteria bacterium]